MLESFNIAQLFMIYVLIQKRIFEKDRGINSQILMKRLFGGKHMMRSGKLNIFHRTNNILSVLAKRKGLAMSWQ